MKSRRITKEQWIGMSVLLLTAMIWGVAFVSQRYAAESNLGPLAFMTVRYTLATAAMIPVVAVSQHLNGLRGIFPWQEVSFSAVTISRRREQRKELWNGGLLAGLFCGFGSMAQQIGLETTTAGKAGFLTAIYVAMVPIASALLFREKHGKWAWIGMGCSLTGLYFLSFAGHLFSSENFQINRGELIVCIGTLFWTAQIITVGRYMKKGVDAVRLTQMEFAVTAVLGWVATALFEHPTWADVQSCTIPILYTALLSSVVGFTGQSIGQKYANPTAASTIMCLESVFSALAGMVFLHETMAAWESAGAALVFCGSVLAQIPSRESNW